MIQGRKGGGVGKLIALLAGVLLTMIFVVLAAGSAPRSPVLAAVEYAIDPATALQDRAAQRAHDEEMARIALLQYNDKMFWRAATLLVVLAIICAVLGVVLVLQAARVRRVRLDHGCDVYVLPTERKRITG